MEFILKVKFKVIENNFGPINTANLIYNLLGYEEENIVQIESFL